MTTAEGKSALEELIRASVLTDRLIAARANLKAILAHMGEDFNREMMQIHKLAIADYAKRAKLKQSEAALRLCRMFLADHEQVNALGVLAAWLEMIEDDYVDRVMKEMNSEETA